jgi:hypothetical protein
MMMRDDESPHVPRCKTIFRECLQDTLGATTSATIDESRFAPLEKEHPRSTGREHVDAGRDCRQAIRPRDHGDITLSEDES